MPMKDISKIRSKLIGICCLEEKDKARVKRQWDARCSERTAFWVEAASDCSGAVIIEDICEAISKQGILSMHGESCIVALFLDLRKPMKQEIQNTLWNLSDALAKVLGCNIMLVMQFGFVGKVGLSNAGIQRECVKTIVSANSSRIAAIQHRLCLIGEAALSAGEGNNWKAAVVLLDALRRSGAPTDILPMTEDGLANNDIGFLRYEEYDKERYDALLHDKEKYLQLRGTGGGPALKNLVDKKRSEMIDFVDHSFSFRGSLQPQHPDMVVEDSFLGTKRKSALKGKNKEYNKAQQETRTAVMLTGKRMSRLIEEFFARKIAAATETLEEMFRVSNAGVELRADRITMENLLRGYSKPAAAPRVPTLGYSEQGCENEINQYFMDVKACAVSKGISMYDEAIVAAYQTMWNRGFQEEQARIQERLDEITLHLNAMKPAQEFCAFIAFGGDPNESDFKPVSASGSNAKFLLFRGQKMKEIVTAATEGSTVALYEISETGGGLRTLDNAPLKAVQVVFLDCNDQAIEQLLPEVNL